MLYKTLKLILKGTVKVFFRSIHIRNEKLIPNDAPLIIVANHPSMFMDPILIAACINRKVSFLAKGSIFNNGFVAWLLPKLGLIPIHRQQDDPSQLNKNANTFKKCFEHLEKGGAILIFPEGVSNSSQRKLQPLKSGAARIALGAEQRNDFKLGVKISVLGLNYANQHKFNRDVLINVEEPLLVADYHAKYKNAADELTDAIKQKLEENMVSIQNDKHAELIRNIETLYQQEYADDRNFVEDYESTRNIVKAVNDFNQTQPEAIETMQAKMNKYFAMLSHFKLQDEVIQKSNLKLRFAHVQSLLLLLLGFPLYLFGLINNFLPYEIPAFVANRLKDKDLRGSVGMVLGVFTFIIFYSLQISLMQYFFHNSILTFIYIISLPTTGFFAYYYWHSFSKLKMQFLFMIIANRKNKMIENLLTQRNEIMQELDVYKKLFLEKM